jgi:CDP-4-dehydro-6-deoxyglucose reductase, E1
MIPLVKSTFYKEKETKKELNKFITKAEILSFGQECQKFEYNFAKWQGKEYCVFVNSGSSANLALIQALLNLGMLKKGDNVGFSAVTWSTNVMPLIQLGLNSVPIDAELDTLNISSRNLSETLKKYPLKALLITNLLGFCDDINQIKNICNKNKILLLEDNCESLGTVYKGKKLGNFGLASTFSFYVGHHMSTIEGGAICTDDSRLADMLKLVRAHGWDRNLDFSKQTKIRNKHKVNSTFYSRYTFYDLGYNFRPTEINGFIGNTQLKYLNEIIKKRNKNFLQIAKVIYKNKNYYSIDFNHIDLISNFAIPIICKSKKIRDELVAKCEGKIEIRPIVAGDITQQPFYKKHIKIKNKNLNAIIIHNQGFYIGNNPELNQNEIKIIIKILA